jgi:hypothetical protein
VEENDICAIILPVIAYNVVQKLSVPVPLLPVAAGMFYAEKIRIGVGVLDLGDFLFRKILALFLA